ncbi:hypothetical protein QOZ83_15370 [Romboutsia sedimentorum]|uniref:hypothetical protein n=1 Tax=Romboutsia sedimentorum TaxID=1368474 RepID=UPI0024DEB507|nr:hypothetical protein [Romboutsia sedimentorum]MDK2587226.1 hypothetical protein [Romboutsia sedimentorum]
MKRKILSLGLAGIVGILGSINVFADNTETSNLGDKTGGKTQEEWAEWKINNLNKFSAFVRLYETNINMEYSILCN